MTLNLSAAEVFFHLRTWELSNTNNVQATCTLLVPCAIGANKVGDRRDVKGAQAIISVNTKDVIEA